ncbi:MAG: acylphosphatase [Bacteroidetes bacterium]|nr:acylphosphatase [Bacteroidota bacterium]
MKRHVKVRVSGKVQGVFFRASTKEQADRLGVQGFVRNEPNGDVYIEAEAEENIVKEFLNWCSLGPTRARVDHLEIADGEMKNYQGFEVRR